MTGLLIDSGKICSFRNDYQARVLREVSPEEVTANIFTLVDVYLHHFQIDLQQGLSLKVPLLFV